jgi:hypothetical protein
MWDDPFLHVTFLTQSSAYKQETNTFPHDIICTVYSQSVMVTLFAYVLFTLYADINKRVKNDRTTLSNG